MIKSKVIQVRFSEENVIGITAKTRLNGMSISGWIRMIVLRELNSEGISEKIEASPIEFGDDIYVADFPEDVDGFEDKFKDNPKVVKISKKTYNGQEVLSDSTGNYIEVNFGGRIRKQRINNYK